MLNRMAFILFSTLYLGLGLMNLAKLQTVVPFQYRSYGDLEAWQKSWGWINIFAGILSCTGLAIYYPGHFVHNKTIAMIILISLFVFLFVNLLYLSEHASSFSPYCPAFSRSIRIVIIFESIIISFWLILCAGRWGSVVQTLG